MAPFEIEILIRCHTRPDAHPQANSTTGSLSLDIMVSQGLITPSEGWYKTTPRGAAHIEQLCKTPWPIQVWVAGMAKLSKLVKTMNDGIKSISINRYEKDQSLIVLVKFHDEGFNFVKIPDCSGKEAVANHFEALAAAIRAPAKIEVG